MLHTGLVAIIYEYYEIKTDFYKIEGLILNSYFICNLDNPSKTIRTVFEQREVSVILDGDL